MSEFDKIVGYNDVKKELVRICDVIKNSEKYQALGVASLGGLLLDGVPGVGKTLMANCFIDESGLKAFVCRKNKPDGEFVNVIKSTFDEASKNAPSIVFLDDMDKFANQEFWMDYEKALDTLDDECKSLAIKHFKDGQSLAEIAAKESISYEEIDARFAKMLRLLRHPNRAKFLKKYLQDVL